MEKVGLNITPKEFKQLSKWSENVYNIAVIVDYCLVVGAKRARSRLALCRQSSLYQINLK